MFGLDTCAATNLLHCHSERSRGIPWRNQR